MGFYIYHIFKPRFCRVHLLFRNEKSNFHTFLIERTRGLNILPTGTAIIKGRKLPFNYQNLSSYKKQMMRIIQKNKVHAVLTSHYIPIEFVRWLKSIKKKVYYLNHGIWNKKAGSNFANNTRSIDWTFFDGYFVTRNEKKYLIRIGVDPNKIHIISGSPQIDYLLSNNLPGRKKLFYQNIDRRTGYIRKRTKYPLSIKKKCVLLLQNPDALNNLGRDQTSQHLVHEEYYQILKTLVDLSVQHKFHIITKLKKETPTTIKRFTKAYPLHKHKNVTPIYYSDHVLAYDLLFADIVIVEGFGTSFIESLLVNPKTIQCQILQHNDDLNVDKYNLLQADHINDLISMIPSLLSSNKLIDQPYLERKTEFIKEHLGDIQRDISRFVTDIMRKNV